MLGKVTGPCKGRGGSQHLCARDLAFYGTNGITGGGIPTATGLALSKKLDESEHVVLCFFGDGAANQGTFHESLNMASIWQLPVVYICENNLYAMSTPVSDSMSVEKIARRAQSYDIPGVTIDGMDPEAVMEGVAEALQRARSHEGPTLIEAKTYRFCGHSKSDRLVYRTDEEEQCWQAVDPITVERKALIAGGLAEDRLEEIEERCRTRIDDAYQTAQQADFPGPDDVLVSPYCNEGETS